MSKNPSVNTAPAGGNDPGKFNWQTLWRVLLAVATAIAGALGIAACSV